MKKREVIAVFIILVLSMLASITMHIVSEKGHVVVIYSNGKEYMSLPVDENKKITVDSKNTVCIENNEVYVEWADCPDKLCVKQGKISKTGKSIVCLPNRLTVKLERR